MGLEHCTPCSLTAGIRLSSLHDCDAEASAQDEGLRAGQGPGMPWPAGGTQGEGLCAGPGPGDSEAGWWRPALSPLLSPRLVTLYSW